MASLKLIVKHVKSDGRASIKVDINHGHTHAFIDTNFVVTKKDLTPEGKLKKSFYNPALAKRLEKYREYVHGLGLQVDNYSAVELKEYLIRQELSEGGKFIDFIVFCDGRNTEILNTKGKNGTYYSNTAAVKWLKKYVKSDKLNINDINVRFLEKFEKYMISNGLGAAGINNYFRAIRTLFKAARTDRNRP